MKRLLTGIVITCFLLTQSTMMVLAAPSWDGEWNTNWGKMTLRQSGSTVTGNYYSEMQGRIEAQVVGNKIVGNWYQSNGSGQIEFVMDSNGAGFQGQWKYADRGGWSSWNGTRTMTGSGSTSDAPSWAGEWNTDWGKMTLRQSGIIVSGNYYPEMQGRIEAQVVGNKIVGNWYQSNGSGQIEFVMNSDGAGFQGKWKYAGKADWSSWNGRR